MRPHARPLPPGPRIGDHITLKTDVLVEVARESRGTPPSWRFLPCGTRARLLGWRDHGADEPRAVIDVPGDRRFVAFVRERHLVM